MSSLSKMLEVLDLFSAQESLLTGEEIAGRLGYTRPTAYRYIRELCAVGLLGRFAGGYSLGPRIIELDFIVRQSDPLLGVATGLMRAVASRYNCEVVLITMFGDRVVTVHEEKGSESPPIGFGRGRPLPLFRGSGSKIILAFLPAARQRKLFAKFPEMAAASELGADWNTFRASLRKIRSMGHAISFGELDPPNVGIAAPVFGADGEVVSSLAAVMNESQYQVVDKDLLVKTIVAAASRLSESITRQGVDELGLPLVTATQRQR
jgi:DNA-binding IclR family transcriptional regulator